MALQITITNAGRAEIINAENNGTGAVTITEIGFGSAQYAPSKAQTALQAPVKRVNSIAGLAVAADTIHVIAKDESAAAYNVGEFGLFSATGTLVAVYSQPAAAGWILQKAGASTLLLAVDIILESLAATSLVFGDITFLNPPATTSTPGVVELANDDEILAGLDSTRAVTPAGLKLKALAHKAEDDPHSQYLTKAAYNQTPVQVSAPNTVLSADQLGLVLVNATAGAATVRLPPAADGLRVILRRTDATTNAAVVAVSGSDKLMLDTTAVAAGQTTTELLFAGDYLSLRADAAGKWWCVGQAQLPASINHGLIAYRAPGSRSFAVPAVLRSGRRRARVTVIGAGAGGGACTVPSARGAGGGAGGVAKKLIDLAGISTVVVTVGAGTTTDGEASSFGAYCSATGGLAGQTYTGDNAAGGGGGYGAGGDINTRGNWGSDGPVQSGGSLAGGSGDGGAGLFGGAGRSAIGQGFDGEGPGAGAGGSSINARSKGADGAVIIEW